MNKHMSVNIKEYRYESTDARNTGHGTRMRAQNSLAAATKSHQNKKKVHNTTTRAQSNQFVQACAAERCASKILRQHRICRTQRRFFSEAPSMKPSLNYYRKNPYCIQTLWGTGLEGLIGPRHLTHVDDRPRFAGTCQ